MKILVHDYAGHPFPIGLSRELARRGHETTHAFASQLLTPRGSLSRGENDPTNIRFTAVPMSPDYRANKYNFLKRRTYERNYGHQLARLLEQVRPDVVLSGQTPSDPQLTLLRTAEKMDIPVITWVQDFYSLAVDKLARRKLPMLGWLAGAWYRHLDSECFSRSAAIISITDDFQPILAKFGVPRERITVIPNWAPLEEFPLRPRQNEWSQRHGINGKFVFLYSGTLAMKHNPDLLRKLCLHFRADPNVRVVVVSEGPGASYLAEKKISEHLENLLLLPFQSFAEMPDVLAAADVCLAILEPDAGVFSVPSKVLTYHVAARPILGAIPAENLAARIIVEQNSGICVSPRSLDAFVAAAARLRQDKELRTTLGKNARAYAERDFDIERIAARFEQIFEQVMLGPIRE